MSRPRRSRLRLLGGFGALSAVMGCSLITPLDGLSRAANSSDAGAGAEADASSSDDGGSIHDATADASFDAGSDASERTRTWKELPVTGPSARHSVRMAYDEARQRAVLFGGDSTADMTWEWNGAAWSRPNVSTAPGGRAVGLVYDSDRKVTVLSGGRTSPVEPWEWNGAAWKSSGVSASSPLESFAPGLAYDRARKVLVAFGGIHADSTIYGNETWEWSVASGFGKRSLPVSPPGRSAHVLVYDIARSRVVLYGGFGSSGLRNDLWEYDGNTWTERTPALSPPARAAACAAYDASRGVTVVFGGRESAKVSALADTWEWNGTTWRQGPGGPPARRSGAMTFDAARDAIVMYGGSNASQNARADTWIYQ